MKPTWKTSSPFAGFAGGTACRLRARIIVDDDDDFWSPSECRQS
jgi:hypothetical protein